MARRKRRGFTREYKAEVVELVRTSGRSVGAIAKQLDLSETAVRRWAQQAAVDAGRGRHGGLLREGERVRYTFIGAEEAKYPVRVLCRCLEVSAAGCYGWLAAGAEVQTHRAELGGVSGAAEFERKRCYLETVVARHSRRAF